jgi:hypothetical protein
MGFRPLTVKESAGIAASLRKSERVVTAAVNTVVQQAAVAVVTAVEAVVDPVEATTEAVEPVDVKLTGKNPFKKKP